MRVYYDKINQRLVYVGKAATPSFWDRQWRVENLCEYFKKNRDSRFILKTLKKYIPDKKGKIIEGGCGRGQYVYCMHSHGYDVVGIDFALETIKHIKKCFPELNVQSGDLRFLNFPDNYFSAYWSLGVIEHDSSGYFDLLNEIKRVLDKDGYLFLTFPYMSPIRKLKGKLGFYEVFREDYNNFYQFALDDKVVIADLLDLGFHLVEKKPFDGLKGFKEEFKLCRPIIQKLYDSNDIFLVNVFKYGLSSLLALFAGHSVFLVFRKV
jgi:SAM-dependent methyltransferase